MPTISRQPDVVSFDAYEIHLSTQELFKHGARIKIAPQAFRVLQMLVENPGRLVAREEFHRALWPADTFVDFDQGLNNAVKKIRDLLNDSAETPLYIETLPRLGYRFIGQMKETPDVLATDPGPSVRTVKRSVVAGAGALLSVALLLLLSARRIPNDRMPTSNLEIVPLVTLPGNNSGETFSPDGSQIAFVHGDGFSIWGDIYVKTLDNEKMLRITNGPGQASGPVWSPDGEHIAYGYQFEKSPGTWERGIYLISPLGGGNHQIRETAIGVTDLGWSPDGSQITYQDMSDAGSISIYLMSASGTSVRRLTTPLNAEDTKPAFSHDGKRVAFVRETSFRTRDIYIVDASGGEPQRLTFMNTNFGLPAWTTDDRKIIFGAGTGGSADFDLYAVPVGGGKPERLPFSNYDATRPAISRRGDKLSYMRCLQDINIWKLTIPDSIEPESMFAASSSRLDAEPEFSPDGSKVAFMSDRDGEKAVWVSDAAGNNATRIASAPTGGGPRWSPDGRQIAFESRPDEHARIMIVGVDGAPPRRLTDEDFEEGSPSWSADGRWVYFSSAKSGSMEIWKASPTTRLMVQVTFHGGYLGQAPNDGRFIYYFKPQRFFQEGNPAELGVWRVPEDGGPEERVNKAIRPPLHPTAEGIYYVDNSAMPHAAVKFFDFDSGKARVIGQVDKESWEFGLAISPDRHTLLHTRLDGGGCALYLVKGGSW